MIGKNVSWSNRGDGQNSGNTRHYRNTAVCVGCTERTLVVSVFRYSFVCSHCFVPMALHYRVCLVTVLVKVLQNWRLVICSKRTDCCYAFSRSICNQNGHSVLCIQTSSIHGYDGMGRLHQLRGIATENLN